MTVKTHTEMTVAEARYEHDLAYEAWRDGRKAIEAHREAEITALENAVTAAAGGPAAGAAYTAWLAGRKTLYATATAEIIKLENALIAAAHNLNAAKAAR